MPCAMLLVNMTLGSRISKISKVSSKVSSILSRVSNFEALFPTDGSVLSTLSPHHIAPERRAGPVSRLAHWSTASAFPFYLSAFTPRPLPTSSPSSWDDALILALYLQWSTNACVQVRLSNLWLGFCDFMRRCNG